MKKNLLRVALATALIFSLFACNSSNNHKSSSEHSTDAPVYQCPMKCEGEKTYDKPTKCTVCNMNLEKVEHQDDHEHSDHQH